MSLRISLQEDAIQGASQAFETLEAIKQALGLRKIISDAPLADPETLIPEVHIEKLFDNTPEKLISKTSWSDL